MATTASNIRDITNAFLEANMKDEWGNVARTYQHHVTADELFTKRMKTGAPSEKVTFNLKTDEADNTTPDSFFNADSLNRTDLFRKGEVKWSFQKTHFMVDRREPVLMTGKREQLFDYYNGLKSDMYDGFFKQNEIYMWTNPTAPNDGTAGHPLPYGVPHWIVSDNNISTTVALTGDTPTGYSTVANVSSSNVANWKNWQVNWSAMDNSDFCRKLETMLLNCNFRPPKPVKEEKVPDMGTLKMYSDRDSFLDYGDALYGSNENVGKDMARFRGGKPSDKVGVHYYNGIEWVYVPALTTGDAAAAAQTVYLINWSTFQAETYGDLFMSVDEPLTIDSQHNTIATWMDSGWQMYCCNRRANGVLVKA